MEKNLFEIAAITGGEILGDGAVKISGLNRLDMAKAGDLCFSDEIHIDDAKNCAASAVIIPSSFNGDFPKPAIKVENPRAAFAKLLEIFIPKIEIPIGISDKAFIGKNVDIADDVKIMPFAYIGDGVKIESGAVIYPHTYIGHYSTIGAQTLVTVA